MPDDSRQAVPAEPASYTPANKLRFVTAAALFDGHDAAINIMRRILQAQGAEVVHLGHNRSVDQIVEAAIEEDVHGIAVSSYQGGHVEFFKYMIDRLNELGAGHIKVFGGGGGTIVPEELRELHDYGVARLYSPYDGQVMGLAGMILDMFERADADLAAAPPADLAALDTVHTGVLARAISAVEAGTLSAELTAEIESRAAKSAAPVVGITGTGGAGKSSLTDELVQRFRLDRPDMSLALLAVDPTRRRSGGALLGDRIRMNAIDGDKVYMRSLATRASGKEI
ncbi:MAG: cobalamin-dependent protein, partial [Alphaproteobacteria bacterium]